MSLFDYPGFMPYGDGSFEVLHADWPVYPGGHGWEVALGALAVFPAAARFMEIDEIDRCSLLVATSYRSGLELSGDLFDLRWFHVAAWSEDLLELHRRGLIGGGTTVSEYEAALEYYEAHKYLSVEHEGVLQPLNLPRPCEDDFEPDGPPLFRLGMKGIALSKDGIGVAESLARPVNALQCRIRERVAPLIEIHFRDTAVREAAVLLESTLREATNSHAYGQSLVEQYLSLLRISSGGQDSAFIKVLRGELRTLFKFVRNDFAHGLRDITEGQCRLLLHRFSLALETIDQIGLRS